MLPTPAGSGEAGAASGRRVDPLSLTWLMAARWITAAAAAGAALAGHRALDAIVSVEHVALVIGAIVTTNVLVWWQSRQGRFPAVPLAAGLMALDVGLFTWLLVEAGGILNPASVFYLVEIVLAALVLGRVWAWSVTALSVAGYALLFLAPTGDLRAALAMHPEIARHMTGMWIAFGATALAIAFLVTRLVLGVERRDRALAALRDRAARQSRAEAIAAVVAGAAHELNTPLATMAVAARELERALDGGRASADLVADARLIRAQVDRCRDLLNDMSRKVAAPAGEPPRRAPVAHLLDDTLRRLPARDRARVVLAPPPPVDVNWPPGVVAQVLLNVLTNALQATNDGEQVELQATAFDGALTLVVADRGAGMGPDVLARAGEPFFTTKAAGEGLGLGLFVARTAVEALGGRLSIASVAGTGTTVTLTLPVNVLHLDGTS